MGAGSGDDGAGHGRWPKCGHGWPGKKEIFEKRNGFVFCKGLLCRVVRRRKVAPAAGRDGRRMSVPSTPQRKIEYLQFERSVDEVPVL